jgi:hypothetical protein
MTMTTALKTRERNIRRRAARRGLRVVKEPGDLSWGDLGAYYLMEGGKVIHVVHQVAPERKVTAADWRAVLDQMEGLVLTAGER